MTPRANAVDRERPVPRGGRAGGFTYVGRPRMISPGNEGIQAFIIISKKIPASKP